MLSTRGIWKIPILLLLLPVGLLFTFVAMVLLPCVLIALAPFYILRYLIWYFSAPGRIHRIQQRHRRQIHKVIVRHQRIRTQFSSRSNRRDLQHLVKFSKLEITKRKHCVDHVIFNETKRRLNRCLDEMNFEDALHIYSTIVDTELDLLNERLNQLFN